MTEVRATYENVGYLPQPNTIEVVVTDEPPPRDLTTTAFLLPIFDDGSVLLSRHRRRGVEPAGGHIEPGETPEQAAARELYEETGCVVRDVRPVGYLRMTSHADAPPGWRYPHPVSYQQFFIGRVMRLDPYVVNAECGLPEKIGDVSEQRPSVRVFVEEARRVYQL
jgi:8-oxo-dGTP diphosphatase